MGMPMGGARKGATSMKPAAVAARARRASVTALARQLRAQAAAQGKPMSAQEARVEAKVHQVRQKHAAKGAVPPSVALPIQKNISSHFSRLSKKALTPIGKHNTIQDLKALEQVLSGMGVGMHSLHTGGSWIDSFFHGIKSAADWTESHILAPIATAEKTLGKVGEYAEKLAPLALLL
jgi:hypothetical protein